ncbi:MAG: hypothetical protein VB934_05100, partial [Polyangiaceae bacterium]
REPKHNLHHPVATIWRAVRSIRLGTISAIIAALLVTTTSHAVTSPARGPETKVPHYLQRGEELTRKMTLRSDRIHDLLRFARKARKRKASRCLNGKLNQAHAMERMGDADYVQLRRAAGQGDAHTVSQHFARLERFDERSHFIMSEANGCGIRVEKKRVSRR